MKHPSLLGISSIIATLLSLAGAASAKSLVGAYHLNEPGVGQSLLVFLPNGEYHHAQIGTPQPGMYPGLERGSYTWNPDTGALTASVIRDTNGEWGFSHGIAGVSGVTAEADENGMNLHVPGEGNYALSRIASSPTNPMVGGWWIPVLTPAGVNEAGGHVIAAFLPNGTFFMSQDGIADEEDGQDGIEYGTYTWNPANGSFNVNITTDTNGQWGFSHPGPEPKITMGQDTNILILDPDEGDVPGEDTVTFHRITPGSTVVTAWAAGLGLTGESASPTAKPYADGLANVLRYAMNLGIQASPEELPSVKFLPNGGQNGPQPAVSFSFQVRNPLMGVTLIPQQSADMITWEDVQNPQIMAYSPPGESVTYCDIHLPANPPDAAPPRFLRLRAKTLD